MRNPSVFTRPKEVILADVYGDCPGCRGLEVHKNVCFAPWHTGSFRLVASPGAAQEEGAGEGNHALHGYCGSLMMASHCRAVTQPAATPCKNRK